MSVRPPGPQRRLEAEWSGPASATTPARPHTSTALAVARSPRSTIGTVTEIYDYLRLLFSSIGQPHCYQCGAAITLRSFGQAETVVCGSCHSILDAKDPNLAILQQFEIKTSAIRPLIPLGTRGKLRGTDYEVIGFQRRSTKVEGITYYWQEYVLFNPYKGSRYLSEYHGHWNDISVCKTLPAVGSKLGLTANYLGETYQHFQSAEANTDFVLGEFP